MPASLLETLELALADAEHTYDDAFVREALAAEDTEDVEAVILKGQRTLRVIIHELMNQTEREGLEYALGSETEG